jgi:hypothetical protein
MFFGQAALAWGCAIGGAATDDLPLFMAGLALTITCMLAGADMLNFEKPPRQRRQR